jgi:hypothetical protein
MRTLICVFPSGQYEIEDVEEVLKITFEKQAKDYSFLVVLSPSISKPEFYIVPGPKDKLDDSKMIPIESMKEVSETLNQRLRP